LYRLAVAASMSRAKICAHSDSCKVGAVHLNRPRRVNTPNGRLRSIAPTIYATEIIHRRFA
jgi:hypothetical protein